MDRKDFFFRQRVTQSELDDAFLSAELADQNIQSDVLGNGFLISGPHPATVVQAVVPDLTVEASSLLGYDQLGRRLNNDRSGFQGGVNIGLPPQAVDMSIDEVGAPTTVGAPGNERILTIFVEFTRNTTDPRLDGNAATVFFVQDESIQFNVVQSAEALVGAGVPAPARADQLILADVTRIFAQTALLNADIDQSRRQGFQFGLLHGPSHAEAGSDPVPNATAVVGVGGLMSGADKAKLDDVTFTAPGIGTRLANTHYRDFQPANGTAPAATTLDVTGLLIGKSPTGTPLVEGVVVTPPDNTVIVRDTDGDDFLDPSGDKVFARLTEAAGVWTLAFFVRQDAGGGEIAFDMTPFAGTAFEWFIQEAFLIHNVPSANPQRSIPSDQVAAEVPTATTTVQGKVLGAANSPNPPQAGSFNRVQNAGAPLAGGPWNTINLPSGGATDAGGGVVNIPASAGPVGPTGPAGPAGPAGPVGPTGPGFASEGPYQVSATHAGAASGTDVFNFGFTVRFYMACVARNFVGSAFGQDTNITNVTKAGTQVSVSYSVIANSSMATGASAAG